MFEMVKSRPDPQQSHHTIRFSQSDIKHASHMLYILLNLRDKWRNVYLIHEMMLNNQTHVTKTIPETERRKWRKMVLKKRGGGGGMNVSYRPHTKYLH